MDTLNRRKRRVFVVGIGMTKVILGLCDFIVLHFDYLFYFQFVKPGSVDWDYPEMVKEAGKFSSILPVMGPFKNVG